MREEDFGAFSEVLVGFAELKGRALSSAAIKLFWNAMQAWTIEDFRAAANRLLSTCEFMPTPRDFEKLRAETGRDTAGEAWQRAQRYASALYSAGSFRHGEIGDPAIDLAVAALGGYPAIAMCDTDKLHFLERRFSERYAEQLDVQSAREALPNFATPSGTIRIRHDGPRRLGDILPALPSQSATICEKP